MTGRWHRWLATVVCCAGAVAAGAQEIDNEHSRIGFELRTRWGQQVDGTFARHQGRVTVLADGSQQVQLTLAAAAIEVAGSPYYTEIARGPQFFDADRYPHIHFLSEPHLPALVHDGGRLRGKLTLHGVTRRESFILQPADCVRPGRDCDVVASGVINRADYGLSGYRLVLSDRVRFTMRVRLKNEEE